MLLLALSAVVHAAPAHVETWRDKVDWDAAGDEAALVLADYLRVDTINPPGNEDNGVAFLGAILDQEGIAWQRVQHRPGRSSLIARLDGGGDPLCLLSHIDVVPSEEERWLFPPMSGHVEGGMIWGRGALDMKGMGVVELMSMVWLKRLQVPLQRDVVLIAVADEEVDNFGAIELVEKHWDDLRCTTLINEGGLGIRDALFEGQTFHAISVAEKGTLWVRLKATGKPGHGSTPEDHQAPDVLRRAMDAVDKYKPKPKIPDSLYAAFKEVGRHKGGIYRAILGSRALVNLFVRPKLMKVASTQAAITDTVNLTGMSGANQPNVVPSEVWAQYDCRLLPETSPEEHLARLQKLTRKVDNVEWEVLQAFTANGSPWDDPVFEALSIYAVEDRPDAVAGPVLSVGFTDSIFVRPKGVHAYGYVPFVVTQDEALTMHGDDERVSIDNVREGTRRLFSAILHVAAKP